MSIGSRRPIVSRPRTPGRVRSGLTRANTPAQSAAEQRLLLSRFRPILKDMLVAPTFDALSQPNPVAPRVLLAEDSRINRQVAEGMLRVLGYRVDTANHGQAALAAFERTAYDAILMDCLMPEMDGWQATREIRAREGAGPRTPIVALTANARASGRQACLEAGMDDVLPKPVRLQDLAATLARWIPGSAASAPETSGSTRVVVPHLLNIFLAQAAATLGQLRNALEEGKAEDIRALAHRLAGDAALVGAADVADLCRGLEDAPDPVRTLRGGGLSGLEAHLTRLEVRAAAAR